MLFDGEFLTGVDLADISLWAFTLFFIWLVFYLRREDRREGYPLESDTTGRPEASGSYWFANKKTFRLPHNKGTVTVPHGRRDARPLALKRTAVWPGAPMAPTGDPMRDGVGPASWAQRSDWPDLTIDGGARIVPYRAAPGFSVAREDGDPRGMTVYGADNAAAGEVVDLWVDRSESLIRYLEVKTAGAAPRNVLLPINFARIDKDRRRVRVDALLAAQFANVPGMSVPNQVSRLEEDKICGYYGGGKLYATPGRTEPFL